MTRTTFCWTALILAGISSLQAAVPQQSASPVAPPASQYRTILNRYCVTCHNDKLKTAGLMLDKLDVVNVPAGAEAWEKVIRKLRGNAMPPPGLPRPDASFYNSFAAYLETSIDHAAVTRPNPGKPTIHRLNRAEYANAVRDLLAVDVNGEALFPVDDSGYGFDNNGAVLSVSPVLLERYMSAARKVSLLAIGDPSMHPVSDTYELPDTLIQQDRMSEDLPLGSRGGMAFRHNFPADGEYVIKIQLKRDGAAGIYIRGVGLQRQLDVLLDRKNLKRFTVGGEHLGRAAANDGVHCNSCTGDSAQEDYDIHRADASLEVRFPVQAGPHLVGVAFQVAETSEPEGIFKGPSNPRRGGRNAEPWVQSVVVSGPYNVKGPGDTPSRQKIFVCHPVGNDDDNCAKKILSTLAHRAYRRRATDKELQILTDFYKAGRSGGDFETGIGKALERILGGPEFLFRMERTPADVAPGEAYPIGDLELASRLSFFLWSSIPDDQLLDLAEQGKLKDRGVLEVQVRRMLRDPRSKALVSNFFGQWLQLRRVAELSPDPLEFPDFDLNLRQAFQQETELFLESMMSEDRPLMELLDAKYTFLNERLAQHYGIPNVFGSSFRRVALTDETRRGLLGQGSVLSLTSYPTRTSVVLRGVWLLTNIMGTPPPAPPPNVPALKDRGDDGKIKSVRQSMEEHRANPVCASCHARMDPLGFALENFNAIGGWRTTEGADHTRIDSSGVLPDGTMIQGPAELREILLSKPDLFATTVTEKLLTYALGRGVEYYDEPAVRKIRRESAPDYRWSSLILGIVYSEPFQMRRSLGP